VSSWSSVLSLFENGTRHFGTLDVVLANAGINEVGNLLEDTFETDGGLLAPPNLQTLSVNLLGVLYTTKCAVHYFAKHSEKRCQLVFTGSAAW